MVCDEENVVCDKFVCERSCVWKLFVKDGVWQSGVWKMVCGKRTRCRVPRCRVETSKLVTYRCDCTKRKVHCWIRKCKPAQNINWVPGRHWHAASLQTFLLKSAPATPATRNEDRCRQVPRLPPLPRKIGPRHRRTSAPQRATRASPVPYMPRLPRKTIIRWMWPSSKPATRNEGGCRHEHGSDQATQNAGGCRQVPQPRETKLDVAKCHACHAKLGGVIGDQACPSAPQRATRASPVP